MKIRNLKPTRKALLGVIAVAIVALTAINEKELSQIKSKYTIDLDGNKETSIPFSTYFKSLTTIILETNENCLIGQIDELQIFDGCIYILDRNRAKSLLVFDADGRFIRKIGNFGQGPGEYIHLWDFTLDTENRFIYLLDYGQRVHKYHLDGTFVKTVTPKVQKSNIYFIQFFKNRLYISTIAYKPAPNDYMLLETDLENGEILSKSLPLKYNKGWAELIFTGHNFFMSRLNAPPLYSRMFMDYIVSVGEDITPYIEIKSKNLVTDKDLGNISNINGDIKAKLNSFSAYFRNSLKIFDINSYVENEEFILFMYQQGWMNYKTAVFHKKTGYVETGKFCKDIIYMNGENRFFGGFKFSDTQGAYEILHTSSIESFQESIRNNEVVPELDKLDKLSNLEEDANPVLFYYEFK